MTEQPVYESENITMCTDGRPGVIGTGMLASARSSMYTSFDDVRELEILPKQHLIRLNEKLSRNQVYAEDEDFAFVPASLYVQQI